jgi:hypothetical protein
METACRGRGVVAGLRVTAQKAQKVRTGAWIVEKTRQYQSQTGRDVSQRMVATMLGICQYRFAEGSFDRVAAMAAEAA